MCVPKSTFTRVLSLMFVFQVCYVSLQLIFDINRQPHEPKQPCPEQQLFEVSLTESAKNFYSEKQYHTHSSQCCNKSDGQIRPSLRSFFTTNYTSEKFTIIVPTYKRNYCIYSSLRHYCKFKHVAMIIVLWNNLEESIPRYLKKLRCSAGVKFMKMKKNRMTTRYILFPEIQTEGMVLT